ncbi:MAG: RNA-dependent DNA polymerase [bacterium]|nr:RNA-dependent DNA polymerase [bacterium]
MKRIGNLFEQIVQFDNLQRAAHKAFRGSKKYTPAGARFYFQMESELLCLEEELRSGSYRPQPYRSFRIYEPKERLISASDFRDRVVHHAICNVLEPIFERGMIFDSYACRRGKGAHAAIARSQYFARRFRYVLKCDIRKHFESLDHAVLQQILARKIKDRRVLALLSTIIEHAVPHYRPGQGLPIGALTSQLFANLYLNELDHLLKERLQVTGYLRYMDDFLLFGLNKQRLRDWLVRLRDYLHTTLRLDLKEEALRLLPVSEGIPFLGFRVFPGLIRLDRRQQIRFRRKIRQREQAFREGDIDEETLVRSVNSLIAHIAHADSYRMRRALFWSAKEPQND